MSLYEFRFDDVSVNTEHDKLVGMIEFIRKKLSGSRVEITLAVSPGVHRMEGTTGLARERVFPSMLHTQSDFTAFYRIQKIGIPKVVEQRRELGVLIAAHGLIHVDHRLLSRKAQEMSIVTSCSLLDTQTFVPPFHKWNEKTQAVCNSHAIHLVRYEDVEWRHLAYAPFDLKHQSYYLHTHDFSYEQFVRQFS